MKLERLKNIKYLETTNGNTILDEKSVESSLNLSGKLEKFREIDFTEKILSINNDDNDNQDDNSVKEEPTEILPDIFDYNSTPAMLKTNENGDNSEVHFTIF